MLSRKWKILICIILLVFCALTYLKLNKKSKRSGYIFIPPKSNVDAHLKRLVNSLVPVSKFIENLNWKVSEKSYVINKEDVYICMLDENGDIYDDNTLVYVILHEVAHCELPNEIGHTKAFEEKFQDLLNRAYFFGLYNPSIPMRTDYCMYNE